TAGSDCFGELLYVAQRSNRAMQVVGPYLPFSYSLSAPDTSAKQGGMASTTIAVTLNAGISQKVTLKATGLPSGTTGTFSQTSCTPTCSSVYTISTVPTTPAGTYTITIS